MARVLRAGAVIEAGGCPSALPRVAEAHVAVGVIEPGSGRAVSGWSPMRGLARTGSRSWCKGTRAAGFGGGESGDSTRFAGGVASAAQGAGAESSRKVATAAATGLAISPLERAERPAVVRASPRVAQRFRLGLSRAGVANFRGRVAAVSPPSGRGDMLAIAVSR